jgi:hypothetical protein
LPHAFWIVYVGCHHLGTQGSQCLGLVRIDISGEGSSLEAAARIALNRTHQSTTLGTGRAHYRNSLCVAHQDLLGRNENWISVRDYTFLLLLRIGPIEDLTK